MTRPEIIKSKVEYNFRSISFIKISQGFILIIGQDAAIQKVSPKSRKLNNLYFLTYGILTLTQESKRFTGSNSVV